MDGKTNESTWAPIIAVFAGFYYLPAGSSSFDNSVLEAFQLAKWYAQEHVLLCLVPAFFIAGAAKNKRK